MGFQQDFKKFIGTAWDKQAEKQIVKILFDNKENILKDETKGKSFINQLVAKNKSVIIKNCSNNFITNIGILSGKELTSSAPVEESIMQKAEKIINSLSMKKRLNESTNMIDYMRDEIQDYIVDTATPLRLRYIYSIVMQTETPEPGSDPKRLAREMFQALEQANESEIQEIYHDLKKDTAGDFGQKTAAQFPELLRESVMAPNKEQVDELLQYVINDGTFYRTDTSPAIDRLKKFKAQGQFSEEKAITYFKHLAEKGSRRYAVEFGTGQQIFTKADIHQVAKDLYNHYKEDILGTWKINENFDYKMYRYYRVQFMNEAKRYVAVPSFVVNTLKEHESVLQFALESKQIKTSKGVDYVIEVSPQEFKEVNTEIESSYGSAPKEAKPQDASKSSFAKVKDAKPQDASKASFEKVKQEKGAEQKKAKDTTSMKQEIKESKWDFLYEGAIGANVGFPSPKQTQKKKFSPLDLTKDRSAVIPKKTSKYDDAECMECDGEGMIDGEACEACFGTGAANGTGLYEADTYVPVDERPILDTMTQDLNLFESDCSECEKCGATTPDVITIEGGMCYCKACKHSWMPLNEYSRAEDKVHFGKRRVLDSEELEVEGDEEELNEIDHNDPIMMRLRAQQAEKNRVNNNVNSGNVTPSKKPSHKKELENFYSQYGLTPEEAEAHPEILNGYGEPILEGSSWSDGDSDYESEPYNSNNWDAFNDGCYRSDISSSNLEEPVEEDDVEDLNESDTGSMAVPDPVAFQQKDVRKRVKDANPYGEDTDAEYKTDDEVLQEKFIKFVLKNCDSASRYMTENGFNLQKFLSNKSFGFINLLETEFKKSLNESEETNDVEIEDILFDDEAGKVKIVYTVEDQNEAVTRFKVADKEEFFNFIEKQDPTWEDFYEYDEGNEDYPQGYGTVHNTEKFWDSLTGTQQANYAREFLKKVPGANVFIV